MSCVPMSPNAFDVGPRDYLNRIITLISTLRGEHTRYLPLLQSKISEVLPSYQMPVQVAQSIASSVYGAESSEASTPGPHESSPYDNPQPLALRPAGGLMHYSDQSIPNQLGGPSGYPAFTTSLDYQDGTGGGMYSTHAPASGRYSG
jgi:hypothetical protein